MGEMPNKINAPYGSWSSQITADWIAAGTVEIGQIQLDGGSVYWNEVRPSEKGRSVVRRREPDGCIEDFSADAFSVRSRAHEYGGGAFTIGNSTLWFSNDADGRVYRQSAGAEPEPLTAEGQWRFADLEWDDRRSRLIAVRENHEVYGREPLNELVAIAIDGQITVLAKGNDFYASPKISPDGHRFAWLSWSHPNMPWDGCELWCSELDEQGELLLPKRVAGGVDESIFQPEFSPDGKLYFVSDRSGWWNIYRHADGEIEQVLPLEADFGLPQWVFGMSMYGFASENTLVATYILDGLFKICMIGINTGDFEPLLLPFVEIQGLKASAGRAVFLAGGLKEPRVIVSLETESREISVLYHSASATLDAGNVSRPITVTVPVGKNEFAHGFFYHPQNAKFDGLPTDLPPLIVKSHGGPTGQTTAAFDLKTQFWTSRGFAVLDMNYRGSTGFGRAYRHRLNGEWGRIDLEDCAAGARWLSNKEWVDEQRMAISGRSAGGYTTLCALTFANCFSAGASHYGIGDLSALVKGTHKFESRYLDGLVGPWPEAEEEYRARSPINHVDGLDCPVIFFQGLQDKVVPSDQAEAMVEVLREKRIAVAYVTFPEEGHGFRQAANIKAALEGELYFYGKVFKIEPADNLETLLIENL